MKNLKVSRIILDSILTIAVLLAAWFVSSLLLPRTGIENNSALIFLSAVVIISSATQGFAYGILASIVSTFCINWFFMRPYGSFNITTTGYTVASISTLTVAIVVCTLTWRIKKHARNAEERERQTKELYAENSKLEKEKAAMELNSAKADIRSNILMSVSHDLRTPLTAISGAASVVLSQNSEEYREKNIELIEGIKDQAEWMSTMVENIISVAKLGGDISKELQLQAEIPDEIIESCVVKVRRLAPDAEIILNLTDDVVLVKAEPILIRQVLLNLLENAVRHSGSNGPFEVITEIVDAEHEEPAESSETEAAAAGATVWAVENKTADIVKKETAEPLDTGKTGLRFTVRDHGKGLPQDIFEQINKGNVLMDIMSGDSGSRGIGISACQSILRAHGSRLTAAGTPGGGTELSFILETIDIEE